MKLRTAPILLPLLFAASAAFADVPDELTGSWRLTGELPGRDGEPGMSWMIELELDGERYVRTGYPPWSETATIVDIEQDGHRYTLSLTDWERNSDPQPDGTVTLVLSEDGRSLELDSHTLEKVDEVE